MDKSYIHILIAKFFGNDLSPEIQKKFHIWLLDENFQKEKEKALAALWEEDPAVADDSTFQELEQLHKRMKTTGSFINPLVCISEESPRSCFCLYSELLERTFI